MVKVELTLLGAEFSAEVSSRGNSGVLANQQGHGKRIPHRRTSLTNLATDGTKTGGKERRSTERNTSSTTSTRAGGPESQRRTTDQRDSGSRHGTQEKPRGAIKSRSSRQKIHRHRQLTTPTSSGSARTESARKKTQKRPQKGAFCVEFSLDGRSIARSKWQSASIAVGHCDQRRIGWASGHRPKSLSNVVPTAFRRSGEWKTFITSGRRSRVPASRI
ncbi:hypothetical protein quinque_013643 [Culex quinquefasciatus]